MNAFSTEIEASITRKLANILEEDDKKYWRYYGQGVFQLDSSSRFLLTKIKQAMQEVDNFIITSMVLFNNGSTDKLLINFDYIFVNV